MTTRRYRRAAREARRRIQESYGIARDEAERQVKDWEKRNERFFNERAKV
jgi:hypothetical protein